MGQLSLLGFWSTGHNVFSCANVQKKCDKIKTHNDMWLASNLFRSVNQLLYSSIYDQLVEGWPGFSWYSWLLFLQTFLDF